MAAKLNCWVVAMYLWTVSRARGYAWIRRSKAFLGLIPHFGYAEEMTGHLIVIEYVPPENRRWTDQDRVLYFNGMYQVTVLRKIEMQKFKTLKMATDWATTTVSESDRPSAVSPQPGFCLLCGRS